MTFSGPSMTTDRYHNIPEMADLGPEKRATVEHGANGVVALRKTFDIWMDIGHGVAVLRDLAKKRGGRKTFHGLLERTGYAALLRSASGKKNQAQVTRLLQVVDRETEVRQWRDDPNQVTEDRRWHWASPSAIFKHCPLFAKGGRKPRTIPRVRLEVAIDAVLEHLHEQDEDNRLVYLERLCGPFGFVPVAKAEGAPTRKRKGKAGKAAKGVKTEQAKGSGLTWEDLGIGSCDGYHNYEAVTERGTYKVRAKDNFPSMKFSHYGIELSTGDKEAKSLGTAKTAAQAKALAERHYAAGSSGVETVETVELKEAVKRKTRKRKGKQAAQAGLSETAQARLNAVMSAIGQAAADLTKKGQAKLKSDRERQQQDEERWCRILRAVEAAYAKGDDFGKPDMPQAFRLTAAVLDEVPDATISEIEGACLDLRSGGEEQAPRKTRVQSETKDSTTLRILPVQGRKKSGRP